MLEIGWGTVSDHHGWSVGYCRHCRHHDAIQIGESTWVVEMWYLPIYSSDTQRLALCDRCGRPAPPAREARIIHRRDWSPDQGLRVLFERCAPGLIDHVPRLTAPEELRGLLTWAEQRSAMGQVNCLPGLILGFTAGLALSMAGGLLGAGLGGMNVGVLVGLGVGVLFAVLIGPAVGGIAWSRLEGRKVARKLIAAPYYKYQLDGTMLTELSWSYSDRIQRAVQAVVNAEPGR